MKKLDLELVTGLFLLVGIVALIYVSIRLGDVGLGEWGYKVYADFPTAGGLQSGAVVELAGVEIGRVEAVDLADYQGQWPWHEPLSLTPIFCSLTSQPRA